MIELFLQGSILEDVMSGIVTTAIISTGAFIGRMFVCLKRQEARAIRQSKALLSLARWSQYQLNTLHPDQTHMDIVNEVDTALKNGTGSY